MPLYVRLADPKLMLNAGTQSSAQRIPRPCLLSTSEAAAKTLRHSHVMHLDRGRLPCQCALQGHAERIDPPRAISKSTCIAYTIYGPQGEPSRGASGGCECRAKILAAAMTLSLIHISEPTRQAEISY